MFDRELLAAYSGIKHFRFALEGRPFKLFTDHKPIVSALTGAALPISARQQRQLSFISEFAVTMIHLPGVANTMADALSRPDADTSASIAAVSIISNVESASLPEGGRNESTVVEPAALHEGG